MQSTEPRKGNLELSDVGYPSVALGEVHSTHVSQSFKEGWPFPFAGGKSKKSTYSPNFIYSVELECPVQLRTMKNWRLTAASTDLLGSFAPMSHLLKLMNL